MISVRSGICERYVQAHTLTENIVPHAMNSRYVVFEGRTAHIQVVVIFPGETAHEALVLFFVLSLFLSLTELTEGVNEQSCDDIEKQDLGRGDTTGAQLRRVLDMTDVTAHDSLRPR